MSNNAPSGMMMWDGLTVTSRWLLRRF